MTAGGKAVVILARVGCAVHSVRNFLTDCEWEYSSADCGAGPTEAAAGEEVARGHSESV